MKKTSPPCPESLAISASADADAFAAKTFALTPAYFTPALKFLRLIELFGLDASPRYPTFLDFEFKAAVTPAKNEP